MVYTFKKAQWVARRLAVPEIRVQTLPGVNFCKRKTSYLRKLTYLALGLI